MDQFRPKKKKKKKKKPRPGQGGGKPQGGNSKGGKPKKGRSQGGNAKGGKPQGGRPQGGKGQPKKRGRRKSDIDPSLLVKKAKPVEIKEYVPERKISEMPISKVLKSSLATKGFEVPTEIQDRTLEFLLERKNLLGIAQTGTGKTGAFLIPIIEHILERKQRSYALILVPTRELAIQVRDEFQSMSKGLNLHSACFIGGTNINRDLYECRRESHIVIATPGRLLDLIQRRALKVFRFNTLVLDEFDRMLDMGFVHDVNRIIQAMERREHTLLFSATLDDRQRDLIDEYLGLDYEMVKVATGTSSSENVDQEVIYMKPNEDKFIVLKQMLEDESFDKVLIFEETKHRVKRLCARLNKSGIKSDEIHGNKSQNARQNALKAFKQGKVRVLVATDVAARGIDVDGVSHVINYQLPLTMDSYIHRIGRTGRAGKVGKAFTFVEA
ncbi:MAG: DEAD/DEAH box helicase [Flavobacteriales bacterium]|nr:DEAD/DEAH box helicase [Flavobacteriales bacterium]